MTILAIFIRITSHAIINASVDIIDISIMIMDITIMAMAIIIMVMRDRCIDLNNFRRRTATFCDESEAVILFHDCHQQPRASAAKGFLRQLSNLER
jgi:hypothetical protein